MQVSKRFLSFFFQINGSIKKQCQELNTGKILSNIMTGSIVVSLAPHEDMVSGNPTSSFYHLYLLFIVCSSSVNRCQ